MRRSSVRAERQGGSGEAFYFGGEPETNVVGAKHEAILRIATRLGWVGLGWVGVGVGVGVGA
jgi:hypothetical protein